MKTPTPRAAWEDTHTAQQPNSVPGGSNRSGPGSGTGRPSGTGADGVANGVPPDLSQALRMAAAAVAQAGLNPGAAPGLHMMQQGVDPRAHEISGGGAYRRVSCRCMLFQHPLQWALHCIAFG